MDGNRIRKEQVAFSNENGGGDLFGTSFPTK